VAVASRWVDALMRGAEKKAKVPRLDGGALPPKRVN